MVVKKKKKQRQLTIKQRKFVDEVVKSWNATEAASKVYKVKNRTTASAIGTENLWKPLIKASIEDRLRDAKNMIYTIAMTGEKEDTRVRACQDIIDRIEGKPTQKIVTEWRLDIDLKTAKEEDLLQIIKK